MKVNRALMFSVVGLLAVGLSGCIKKDNTMTAKLVDEKEIAAAVEAGKPMYCIMSNDKGEKIETWTKGEKTKVYGTSVGGDVGMGYMISDEEWTYMWAEGSDEGSKYPVMAETEDQEIPEYEYEDEEFDGEEYDFETQQELGEDMTDDYTYECDQQDISDSTFVPPTTVKFIDVMENLSKSLEGMGSGL